MTISPYLRRVREMVGSELLVLPSVTVLPRDAAGRILLVRRTQTREWMTIGGMVEPDEDPADAAVREAFEEAGIVVDLRGILAALGGKEFRITYPNGDQTSYVTTVYDATVIGGEAHPDGDETDEVSWVAPEALVTIELSAFARAQLSRLGLL